MRVKSSSQHLEWDTVAELKGAETSSPGSSEVDFKFTLIEWILTELIFYKKINAVQTFKTMLQTSPSTLCVIFKETTAQRAIRSHNFYHPYPQSDLSREATGLRRWQPTHVHLTPKSRVLAPEFWTYWWCHGVTHRVGLDSIWPGLSVQIPDTDGLRRCWII